MPGLLPPWTLLAPFLAAAIALNLTPGADMTDVLAHCLGQGREAGLVSALGTILAAVGLSAVLMHSEAAFTAVKLGGAAYLIWLAFKAIREGGAAAAMNERPPAPPGRILEATVTNALLSSTIVNSAVALSMSAARGFVPGSSWMRRALAWFSAAVFVGLVARLALAECG
jgi:threonine/homoserine/homoserine lactone efflux protein